MKRIISILLLVLFVTVLTACSGQASETSGEAPQQAAMSSAEDFKLGDETYALEKWVALPEYDTNTQTGVGLCFVQKEGVAPIVISGGSYKSLIDMTLDMDGAPLSTSNISFIKVEDAPGYTARVTFEFALPKGAALPVDGTIFHTGENEEIAIDLSGLTALPIEAATQNAVPEENAPAEQTSAALDDAGRALCGEWLLDSIIFRTPDADNGIYAIDATMSISEGFEYGRDLILREDMTMISFIDLSALIEAVPELPFTINDLDLKDYAGWTYVNGTMTLTYGGPAFAAVYDEASKELRLTRSGEVAIMPGSTNGMVTQSGSVLIDITMVFKAKE